jgi:hypothetical protein
MPTKQVNKAVAKKVLYEAASNIYNCTSKFSCFAIHDATYILYLSSEIYGYELTEKYANFYGKSTDSSWFKGYNAETQRIRVLLLLFFAEAGL